MSEKMDYYVYVHRRKADNEVFYVGKGRGRRAASIHGRSEWWKRVVAKHGGFITEYVEIGMSEDCAFDLEVETIKFYRDNGHPLCNLTDGGEGVRGYAITEEDRERSSKHISKPEVRRKAIESTSRPVLCSNGMIFASCSEAESWCGKARTSSIVSRACRRKRLSGHGHVWRFLDDCADLQEMLDKGLDAYIEWGYEDARCLWVARTVYCSNGMNFQTCSYAADWLVSEGVFTSRNRVQDVCGGNGKLINGLDFSYEDKFALLAA